MLKRILFFFSITIFSLAVKGQSWQPVADFPATERDDGTFFTINNKTFCGTGLQPWFIAGKDFYALDMSNDSWSAIAELPAGNERQYASGFSDGTNGFITCGSGNSYFNDVWKYDPALNSWTFKTPLPAAGRMGAACFVISNIAYIIGGRTTSNLSINEVWAYDMANDSWTQKNNLPFGARWRSSATAMNNKGYLLFGRDENSRFCNQLFEYTPGTDTWTQISTFPNAGRAYSSLNAIGPDLIVVAGLDTLSNSYSDMWRINPDSLSWQQLQSIPAAGRRGGMCFNNGTAIYYTTGTNQSNTRIKETWKVSNPTPVNNIEITKSISVFSNPANDFVLVSVNENNFSPFSIEITDLTGKCLLNAIAEKNPFEINTSALPSGMYILKAYNVRIISHSKIVVKH